MSNIFIFGLGYTALYFTKFATDHGYHVTATSRELHVKQINAQNLNINDKKFEIINFNNKDKVIKNLSDSEYILVSVPPKDGHDLIFKEFNKEIIKNKNKIKWVGYLSSTGVYGNHDGAWVTEKSECKGDSSSNKARIAAEKEWMSLYENYNIPVHIFRIAGIYGPGRSVIDKIKSGKSHSIYKENQFFSRIHVKDIAGILYASINNPTKGEIYNLSDDMPAASHEVDLYAAKLMSYPNLKIVNYKEANLSEMAKEFFSSNKKVSNAKVKEVLSYDFLFPNYEAGLINIFKKR